MQLNRNPLIEIPFNTFGGGYAGAKGQTTLGPDQALDLDNIVILPNGGGIRNRRGNSEEPTSGNLSTWINPVQGMISFKKASTEHIIYAMELGTTGNLSIIEHDVSGSTHTVRKTVTDGDGQDIFVTMCKFKELVIGTTEERNTPFKVDMSGSPSGADLGGSPPAGKVCFSWNNVVWIGNTSAAPSKLYYSALDAPEDWSSGLFVNPQQGDGDELVTCVPISNNVMLYFKRHSIHQVVGRASPFAVFPLVNGVGCAGVKAAVEADGIVHFITPEGKMRITDGTRIYDDKDFPQLSYADDLWAQVAKTRLSHVVGYRQIGSDYDHIVFLVTLGSGTANNYAIIWDFKNKCWLKNTTGYNGNAACTLNDGTAYIGGYTGRIYKQDDALTYTDDSADAPVIDGSNNQVINTNPDPVVWYWRTDNLALQSLQNIVQVSRINILTVYSDDGTLAISYGYDGYVDSQTITKSIVANAFTLGTSLLGSGILGEARFQTDTSRPLGRGQTFNLKFGGSSAVASKVTRFTLAGKQQGTKVQEVR